LRRFGGVNRSNKSVSAAGESLYEAGFLYRISKRGPEPPDGSVQAVLEIYKCVVRPEFSL
jgi:hypothetical protein